MKYREKRRGTHILSVVFWGGLTELRMLYSVGCMIIIAFFFLFIFYYTYVSVIQSPKITDLIQQFQESSWKGWLTGSCKLYACAP